jgi:hypothetical protein
MSGSPVGTVQRSGEEGALEDSRTIAAVMSEERTQLVQRLRKNFPLFTVSVDGTHGSIGLLIFFDGFKSSAHAHQQYGTNELDGVVCVMQAEEIEFMCTEFNFAVAELAAENPRASLVSDYAFMRRNLLSNSA